MIHGFGGGGPVFSRMVVHLRKYFRVTTIDILGLAGSGRPDYNPSSPKEALSFFIEAINKWVTKTALDQSPFHLLGHSFGGYIAAKYAAAHPTHILSLTLFSPIGVDMRP